MEKLDLTIIVVNWRSEDLILTHYVDLVREVNCDLCIVDNSDTFTSDRLKVFGDRVCLVSGFGNVGFGAAVNLALKYVRTEAIVIANPDVSIRSSALISLYHEWISVYRNDVASPLAIRSDGSIGSWGKRTFPCIQHDVLDLFGLNNSSEIQRNSGRVKVAYASGAFWLMLKSTFKDIGGFDEDFFLYFEETHLAFKMSKVGINQYVNTDLLYIHDESSTMDSDIAKAKHFVSSKITYYQKTKKFAKFQLFIVMFLEILKCVKSQLLLRNERKHIIYAKSLFRSIF